MCSYFTRFCVAFSVPAHLRGVCLPFAVHNTEHKLPALVSDCRGLLEAAIWDKPYERIHDTAREPRVHEIWQSATDCSETVRPSYNSVGRFERMSSCLSLLQSLLPPRYHNAQMLAKKPLDSVRGDWFAGALLAGADHSNPHDIPDRAKLLLTTNLPGMRSPTTLRTSPSHATPSTTTACLSSASSSTAQEPDDYWTGDTTTPNGDRPNDVFCVLRYFRCGSDCPYRTETSPARPYCGPGPVSPFRVCRGPDHLARACPSLGPQTPLRPSAARRANTISTAGIFHPAPADPLTEPPALPDSPEAKYDSTWHLPIFPVSTVYATPDANITTTIAEIGPPGDFVRDTWLRGRPLTTTSPLRSATTRFALSRDVPISLGRLSLRITATDAENEPLTFKLPDVHILRYAAVPLLLGLRSHQRFNMIVDASACVGPLGPPGHPPWMGDPICVRPSGLPDHPPGKGDPIT